MFGVGGITWVEDYRNWENWVFDDSNRDVYLVFEPSVELEFNMTRHLRLAGSIGYRFTTNIDMNNTSPNILKGTNIGLIFKFGKF